MNQVRPSLTVTRTLTGTTLLLDRVKISSPQCLFNSDEKRTVITQALTVKTYSKVCKQQATSLQSCYINLYLLCRSVLQTFMLPSLDADSAFSPLAVNATAVTLSECPAMVCSSCPDCKSHSLKGWEERQTQSEALEAAKDQESVHYYY